MNKIQYIILNKIEQFTLFHLLTYLSRIYLNILTLVSNIWQFSSRRLEVEVHLVCFDNAQPQIFEILSPSWTVYQIHPFQIGVLTCVQFA